MCKNDLPKFVWPKQIIFSKTRFKYESKTGIKYAKILIIKGSFKFHLTIVMQVSFKKDEKFLEFSRFCTFSGCFWNYLQFHLLITCIYLSAKFFGTKSLQIYWI